MSPSYRRWGALAIGAICCLTLALLPQTASAATAGCASAALSSDSFSPQPGGTKVTFTASAAGAQCVNPQYEFWTWSIRSGWKQVQPYSGRAALLLDTTGMAPGTYTIDVWVERSGSPLGTNGYETFALEAWTVNGCDTASLTVTSPYPLSWSVSASASGIGCPQPEFEFWLWQPYYGWSLQQPYSFTSTWSYYNQRVPPGGFTVDVWVRQHGSSVSYDTYALGVLPLSTCDHVNVGTGMTGGPTVTITAIDSCPMQLEYQFWAYLGSSGGWQLLQDYSPSSSATLNVSGLPNGTYSIDVLVKFSPFLSPAYQAYGLATLLVSGCPYGSMNATPTPPATAGTPVALSASSPCAAQYQFWLFKPGGASMPVQGYDTNPNYSWTTTGLTPGTYAWVVLIKLPGSAGADTFSMLAFTLT